MTIDDKVAGKKLNIISLFSGAGGLEIAACKSGLVDRIVSSDSNATFLSTVEVNMPKHFPEVRHSSLVADVREITGIELIKELGSSPSVVMGGPPCDDYTRFGKRRGHEGEKGPLIFEFLRLVRELMPDCFMFENVPNLTQQFKGIFELFLDITRLNHYHVKWALLKACDYGAPTQRTRVFVVGWKNSIKNQSFRFPKPTHADYSDCELFMQTNGTLLPFRVVSDTLSDLPDVKTAAALNIYNHTGRNHKAATIEHFKTIPKGKQVKQSFRYRAPWSGLTQSITAGTDDSTKAYIHPIYHREMTVREYARLHDFPDSWVFQGTNDNGIKQVANSVPIPLGTAVLAALFECLLNPDPSSSSII